MRSYHGLLTVTISFHEFVVSLCYIPSGNQTIWLLSKSWSEAKTLLKMKVMLLVYKEHREMFKSDCCPWKQPNAERSQIRVVANELNECMSKKGLRVSKFTRRMWRIFYCNWSMIFNNWNLALNDDMFFLGFREDQ